MNDSQELEVSSGNKKLRLRGSDILTAIIGIIVSSGLTLVGYIVIEHKADTHTMEVSLQTAIQELTSATKEQVRAQREMNCLISLPQDRREQQGEFCRRVTQ